MRSHYSAGWTLALVLLVSSLLAVSAANNRGQPAKPAAADQQANRLHAPTANTKKVSDSVTNLAAKIANALSNQKSKTEIFSPVSIAGALSLLLLGSGGQTQQELLAVMGLNTGQLSFQDIHLSFGRLFQDLVSNDPSLEPLVTWRLNDKCNRYNEDEEDEEDDFINSQSPSNDQQPTKRERKAHEITLANGIFVQRNIPLSDTYRNQSMTYYSSEVQSLDFELDTSGSTRLINRWVSDKTHGKIPNILPSALPASTTMVLASALYFKALWAESFIDGATKPREFYPDGKGQPPVMVDMMAHGGCFPYYESVELDARIIGIPYKHNVSTMYVIMPNNSNRAKLQQLIPKLTSEVVKDLIENMAIKTSIILFPKMHISNTMDLKRVLQQLGVSSLFQAERSNLSPMLNEESQPDTFINRVQAPTTPAKWRPTVNIADYENRPTSTRPGNNLNDVLIFSRFQNETMEQTTVVPEAADTTEPLTIETTSQSFVPLTNRPSGRVGRTKRDVSYKVPSSKQAAQAVGPLSSKDFILHKRIVKENGPVGKKGLRRRSKRAAQQLYVSNAVHQVDLEVNETGTEGGAATIVTLNRSGTSVVFRAEAPFLLLIRNDQTNLPLFYGPVYHPSS
uniref:SERPIN domain-containing protein n=2 Tax=Anopheles coluzzii TaxID=1518534 RepID=A0A6E8W0F2_ANOCL